MLTLRAVSLACLLAGPWATMAQGQATLFDGVTLRSACLQSLCETTLLSEMQQLQAMDIDGAAFNSQIGAMAALLIDVAGLADARATADIARALALLAGFSSDQIQQNSLLQLANALADGSADLFNLDAPFAVSPN